MGLSYQDVGMVNDSLESLNRAIIAKREAARQAARDKADEAYRSEVLSGNQAEAQANREFRTASAAAEKAHQDRLAGQQDVHNMAMESQAAERNRLQAAELEAKAKTEQERKFATTLTWLTDGVNKGAVPHTQANVLLKKGIQSAPPEMIKGTIFESIGDNFFQDPFAKKPQNTGKTQIKIDAEGNTEKTITRDFLPGDDKQPDDLEVEMKDAQKSLRAAQTSGDPKKIAIAQKAVDNLVIEAEKRKSASKPGLPQGNTVREYLPDGTYIGGDPKAPAPVNAKPALKVSGSAAIQLPDGSTYQTEPITEDDVTEIVKQRAKVADLEKQLKALGTSAPKVKMVIAPSDGYGAGGDSYEVPTTTQDRIKHDLRVQELVNKLSDERKALEALRNRK